MGYRSQVALVVDQEGFDVMNEATRSALDEWFNKYSCEGYRLYIADDIKWYTGFGFDEVDAIENFMNNTDSEHYRFIRLGEDNDDNEDRGGLYDDPFGLGISRSIEYEAMCDEMESVKA
jgi:hypothetical protein